MAKRNQPDDLDRYIAARAVSDPGLSARVAARTNRRILQHQLAELRVSLGITQTQAAAQMGTSQSSIARLESGEHDVRMSTVERPRRRPWSIHRDDSGCRLVIEALSSHGPTWWPPSAPADFAGAC
jgi:DNA-binding XRE family transcriptional regulator